MLDKLEAIKNRFDEVSELIVDPNIISDMKQYIQLNKEYKDCLLYTSPSPRDRTRSRMPSSA